MVDLREDAGGCVDSAVHSSLFDKTDRRDNPAGASVVLEDVEPLPVWSVCREGGGETGSSARAKLVGCAAWSFEELQESAKRPELSSRWISPLRSLALRMMGKSFHSLPSGTLPSLRVPSGQMLMPNGTVPGGLEKWPPSMPTIRTASGIASKDLE